MRISALAATLLAALITPSLSVAAVDEAAAKAYAKQNDCFKCHAPDKTKKGPSYKKISEKFKTKADAEAKMFEHLTTSKKVKLEDGTEEDHKALDKADSAKIKNLIEWIRGH